MGGSDAGGGSVGKSGGADESLEPGPIFVLGCGRSGTTLLRLMLNRHSRIAIPGETWFFPDLCRARHEIQDLPAAEWRPAVEEIIAGYSTFGEIGVERVEIRKELALLERERWSEIVAVANRVFARTEGKARRGDKTPGYVRELPLLYDLFPDAYILHMIRDGRDVAVSFRDKPFGPNGTLDSARWWSRDVGLGRSEGPSLFGERYLEVRYEDLVSTPETVLQKVCDTIGERFESVMLRPWSEANEYLKDEHWWHGRAQKRREIDTSRVERWRDEMPEHEVRVFELEAGDLLEELGYERLGGSSGRATLAWLWRTLLFSVKRLGRVLP